MRTLFYIVILALIAAAVFFGYRKYSDVTYNDTKEIPLININEAPFSSELLAQKGVSVEDIGYHGFSPNGSYFFFTAPGRAYLVEVRTGVVTELPGLPIRGFEDNRIISLFKDNDLILYNPKTKDEDRIKTNGTIFAGELSPDGTTYVFDSGEGIRAYSLKTKTVTEISKSRYDSAGAWFGDNTRMIGYKESGENLFEAGKGRVFGIWNIKDKTFKPLVEDKIAQKSLRSVFWIIPERVARVNAGWDDGSFDYLVEIDTGKVLSLGDTSTALMGGMDEDSSKGLFAVIRSDAGDDKPTAEMYRGAELKNNLNLDTSYFREGVSIVDENRLLYIRKHFNQTTKSIDSTELVLLNFADSTETVLKTLSPKSYARVSLAPDYKTWVLTSGKDFYTGVLQ